MQNGKLTGFVLALSALAGPAFAQAGNPETTACPKAVADIATCYTAKDENGAYLLAAMPKNWNGDLVVFAHGGPSLAPPTPADSQGALNNAVEVKMGYAWIASTYRREGYGVRMAAEDTDNARKFFIAHFMKPKRTILRGTSYGGLVSAKLMETYARNADGSLNYDGAVLLSGALAGAALNYGFRADLRAIYQYYCKNLPRPDEAQYPLWNGIPAQSKMSQAELQSTIDECTGISKPAAARSETQKQNLANILNTARIPERMLLIHMRYATFMFRDLMQNTTHGENAFTNVGIAYKGSNDDAALNKGVQRFTANPAAVAVLKADGEPTGALSIPVIAVHSINDPQVAVESEREYADRVKAAGKSNLLVQAYTDEDQHAAQSPPEVAGAMNQIVQWIEKGTKPTPQSIADACGKIRERYEGPCRFHPDYVAKGYNTRFYDRRP
jgi:alpha-beta hydrolase superfamily lysophospholipase